MTRLLAALVRDQRGFSIVELVLVSAVVTVVLAGVLTTFTSFSSDVERNQRLSESQARTREAIDQMARQLRNLASPTPEKPEAVDHAGPYDLVFQTVDPSGPGGGQNPGNVQRVRYCLDAPASGAPSLWKQVQTWTSSPPPPMPSITACPDPSWPGVATRLVQGMTNRENGRTDRPLFQYAGDVTKPPTITAITMQAWVRSATDKEPRLGVLRSQVFLRNQNEAPVCEQQASRGGLNRLVLNGSGSFDPEGNELTYEWDDVTGGAPTRLGDGIILNTLVTAGYRDIRLRVKDPAGLTSECTQRVLVA